MIPSHDLVENGILIVTGSNLWAEQTDRFLAYELKSTIEERFYEQDDIPQVVVLSDLWYLNAEELHRLPMISIGGSSVNAVSAHLVNRLPNALLVEDILLIQMDPCLEDLRACVWGNNYDLTAEALEIFIQKGYLDRFLEAVAARTY